MLRKGLNILHLLRRLNRRRLWNMIVLYVSYYRSVFTDVYQHKGQPIALSVEPTTQCSLRCPECPVGAGELKRPGGSMDAALLRSLIDELSGSVFWMNLYFQGEPLLNPGLPLMVEYAEHAGMYTVVSTNAQQLTQKLAMELVEARLSKIIISLDGADKKTYTAYRQHGDYDKVLAGIRYMYEARKSRGSSTPYIQVQCLVFKHNEHQLDAVRRNAKSLGADSIVFKTAQLLHPGEPAMDVPVQRKYSRYRKAVGNRYELKRSSAGACLRSWSSAVVSWDGEVAPCCYDKHAAHSYGKVNPGLFHEAWEGMKAHRFRERVQKNRTSIDICCNCPER